MFHSRLRVILAAIILLVLALPTLPVLADCTIIANPYGGSDWSCTGATIGVINGTSQSDTITNQGTVTGYIWSAGFSSSSAQQDTITNNGTVGDDQQNPETNDDDDGVWGSAGNDTIINNGTVVGGATGAIFGDGYGAYVPDQDYIVNNGTTYGDINGDFQARGHDTIIINGLVNGSVYGDINPSFIQWGPNSGGNDLVIIRDNGRVTGVIDGNQGNDTLRFELTPQTQAEYDALIAAFASASPTNGSLAFRDRTFTWLNFETLLNQINWTTTATPTPLTTETPTGTLTTVPTNTPIVLATSTTVPTEPVVNIVVPANDGSPVSTIEDTRFQAIAYDPNVGFTDGAGIQRVEFEIYTPNNVRAYAATDTTAAYCTFGGNGPCNFTNFQSGAPNGSYTLRARAQTTGGIWTNWVTRTFIIGSVPTATATFLPTDTPIPPTLTETPSPMPSDTPETTATDTPTETSTAIPTELPATPTEVPTEQPTEAPPETPTAVPTEEPSAIPTADETNNATPTATLKPRETVATALPPAVPQFYAFGDGRLNKYDIAAPVAVYCYKNGVVGWHITPNSNGVFGFYADTARIADILNQAAASGQHLMITEGMGHSLWALKSNELQVHSTNYDFIFPITSCKP